MIAKTRKSTLAAATIVALTLTGLGVSAIAATSAKNNAATGYVVCVSKTNGDMKLRTKSTCPNGFTTKVFGAKGPAGLTGAQGSQGIQGIQGEAGPAGAIGPIGEIGQQGVEGPQGEQGLQGEQGVQGAPGLDGSAATVYTGYDGGQDNSLLGWSGTDADYKLATTVNILPPGNYLVTATSSFRDSAPGGPAGAECWIAVDSVEPFSGGIQRIVDTYGGAPVALNAFIQIPEGGSTLSFSCFTTGSSTTMTNFDTTITALAVGQVNP